MEISTLIELIDRYKADQESVYSTWFINGELRMKAFRTIRRGVRDVVDSIADGTFGNDFKGSSLEVVLTAITEQKQVFEGAAHPFYWKPKLRIPDIYENEANKRTFGAFLNACLTTTQADRVLTEISRLAAARIKGLGPAVANIVLFASHHRAALQYRHGQRLQRPVRGQEETRFLGELSRHARNHHPGERQGA